MSAQPLPHAPPSPPPRLLDQVRHACRVRHFSLRTEDSYVQWIKRFILFHQKRHPQEMAAAVAAKATLTTMHSSKRRPKRTWIPPRSS